MRRIEMAVGTDIPRAKVDWQRVKDSVRSQLQYFDRTPYSGSVSVGWEWRTKAKQPWQRYGKLWPRVVWLCEAAINGGEPHPGVCRFVQSDEPRLTIILEGK